MSNFPPVNALSKQNRAMRCGMMKTHGLKARRYTSRLIDLKKYLDVFYGEKSSAKICVMELNGIFLNSTTNRCGNQPYVQGFDC